MQSDHSLVGSFVNVSFMKYFFIFHKEFNSFYAVIICDYDIASNILFI